MHFEGFARGFHISLLFLSVSFLCRWLKFEEDVEDGGERWSKPYVATLSLHSLFELRSCILNGTVLLDMKADSIVDIAGAYVCVYSVNILSKFESLKFQSLCVQTW